MKAVSHIKRSATRRTNKFGVSTVRRDTYGRPSDWYALVKEVRERDGCRCVKCGATEDLETHHIRPLSRGGTTTKSNLMTICKDCHNGVHVHLHRRRG